MCPRVWLLPSRSTPVTIKMGTNKIYDFTVLIFPKGKWLIGVVEYQKTYILEKKKKKQ